MLKIHAAIKLLIKIIVLIYARTCFSSFLHSLSASRPHSYEIQPIHSMVSPSASTFQCSGYKGWHTATVPFQRHHQFSYKEPRDALIKHYSLFIQPL